MKHWVYVDRIESELAVLTLERSGESFELPASLLPTGVTEGHWLGLTLEPDPAKDEAMLERARELRGKLARDDDGGDLAL